MKTTDARDPTLHREVFIRQRGSATPGVRPGKGAPSRARKHLTPRGSATQGVPPGKEAPSWVANTVPLIWGEHEINGFLFQLIAACYGGGTESTSRDEFEIRILDLQCHSAPAGAAALAMLPDLVD